MSRGVAVHSVPCRVRVEDGLKNASVDSYFTSSIGQREDGLTASLRGRPLRGVELEIPANYAAVVLKDTGHSSDPHDQTTRELTESETVSSVHYWTLGSTPAPDDRLPQALAWTHISQALHTPLPVTDD